jgi:hypothetical protein
VHDGAAVLRPTRVNAGRVRAGRVRAGRVRAGRVRADRVNAEWPPQGVAIHVFQRKSGGVLLSHRVPPAVPSAQRVLASGFGM